MVDTGKISDGNLSNPKKPLNRRNYYIDRKPQETLDNIIKQRSVNESKPEEIFKDYIWNTISSDVREKQTLFYQAKTDFEQKKAMIGLIEKQKEVKGAEKHVKLKEHKKESKIKDIKKQEKSHYKLKSAVREIEQRLAPCLQDYKQAYSEKSADYKGRLLEQTRYIESFKNEIEKNCIQVAEFRDSKERLLADINGLEYSVGI